MSYTQTYDRLYVTVAELGNPIGCGYHYVVTTSHTANTAFRTRAAFLAWLELYHLSVDGELPEQVIGSRAWLPIIGTYRRALWVDADAFAQLEGQHIRAMDNGDYTLGIVTPAPEGYTVNVLNCNVTRPKYDHKESRELEDAGRLCEVAS